MTHCLNYARLADEIVIMKKGKIALHDESANAISSKEFKALKRVQNDEVIINNGAPDQGHDRPARRERNRYSEDSD